jgi:hypothetical protein
MRRRAVMQTESHMDSVPFAGRTEADEWEAAACILAHRLEDLRPCDRLVTAFIRARLHGDFAGFYGYRGDDE